MVQTTDDSGHCNEAVQDASGTSTPSNNSLENTSRNSLSGEEVIPLVSANITANNSKERRISGSSFKKERKLSGKSITSDHHCVGVDCVDNMHTMDSKSHRWLSDRVRHLSGDRRDPEMERLVTSGNDVDDKQLPNIEEKLDPNMYELTNNVKINDPKGDTQYVELGLIEAKLPDIKEEAPKPKCSAYIQLSILLLANLINYMDRYTIAGVLLEVQNYYKVSNAMIGLLQTSFICSYMVLSPIFGYLGDRYNRRAIMAFGIFFWSAITLSGSYIPENMFWLFLLNRAAVGLGEASYSTIAPTIIADLFVKEKRSIALAVFYFAIPVGSGLGYIVGSKVAAAFGNWQWALRVTPALGLVCTLLIVFVVKEPTRGANEGASDVQNTAWLVDLNKSYMLSAFGFTCVAFVAGALALWAPTYMVYSIEVQGITVSMVFGVLTCLSGLLGVASGSEAARRLKRASRKGSVQADPLVCAFGLITCAPFLFLAIVLSRHNTIATWMLIFIGETCLCLNWAIVTDMILYLIVPSRRSTASAFQILVSHAFGDAGSPYLIGQMSDALRHGSKTTAAQFLSLRNSLYVSCFVAVLGGAFFLATALFVDKDKDECTRAIKGLTPGSGTSSDNNSADGDVAAIKA